jgi:hypothetical protein
MIWPIIQTQGITSLQYLLLLHIKGYPGRNFANVRELAERLQAKPHGVVALIHAVKHGDLWKGDTAPMIGEWLRFIFLKKEKNYSCFLLDCIAPSFGRLVGIFNSAD